MLSHEDIRKLAQDEFLKGWAAAQELPFDDPLRIEIDAAYQTVSSPGEYTKVYQTQEVFSPAEYVLPTYHQSIYRFQLIRERILANPNLNSVLDLGCTDGWSLVNLATARLGLTGVGVDLNPQAIALGRMHAENFNLDLTFVESAIETFRWGHRFDAILVLEVLEHVLEPLAVLEVVRDALKPGGWFFLSVPGGSVPGPPGQLLSMREVVYHLRLFHEPQALLDLVKQVFPDAHVEHQMVEYPEGSTPGVMGKALIVMGQVPGEE